MKNVVLVATAVAIMSSFGSFASAASFNNSCGPTAEVYSEIGEDTGGFSGVGTDAKIGFKIKWTLGAAHKRQCNDLNETVVSQEYHKNRELAAEAKQEEADLLEQRLKICEDFTSATAPDSIVTFCGDLLPK